MVILMGEVSRLYVALVNEAKTETKFGAVRSTGKQLMVNWIRR